VCTYVVELGYWKIFEKINGGVVVEVGGIEKLAVF
jgi:hypothetical protein